jgi:hypothetical protein
LGWRAYGGQQPQAFDQFVVGDVFDLAGADFDLPNLNVFLAAKVTGAGVFSTDNKNVHRVSSKLRENISASREATPLRFTGGLP